MTKPFPLVSIIIPSYNRKDELISCLNSISGQDYPKLEIIVVDDNSSDGTVEAIQSQFPQVHVINGSANCGPSYRRNQGILKGQGKYLLFLDSDVELQEQSVISRLVERFEKDKSIGELGGEIAVYEGETQRAFGRRISRTGHTYRVAALDENEQSVRCDYLATCNCMVRRDTAAQIGGFDPYYEFGSEDTDFGFRIRERGYQNYVGFPYAIYHRASRTGRHPDETYRYKYTRVRFLLKHYGLKCILPLLLLDSVRVLAFYLLLPVKIPLKLLLRKPVRRESYTGGWLILKAYIRNLRQIREIYRTRTANFLSHDEMQRFINGDWR